MGLLKEKKLNNGVIVNYHRIVSLNSITNVTNIIEVASYTTIDKREQEKEANGQNIDVYINTTYYNLDYDESMSVNSAYEYLKTLDEFENAEDA